MSRFKDYNYKNYCVSKFYIVAIDFGKIYYKYNERSPIFLVLFNEINERNNPVIKTYLCHSHNTIGRKKFIRYFHDNESLGRRY